MHYLEFRAQVNQQCLSANANQESEIKEALAKEENEMNKACEDAKLSRDKMEEEVKKARAIKKFEAHRIEKDKYKQKLEDSIKEKNNIYEEKNKLLEELKKHGLTIHYGQVVKERSEQGLPF